MKTSLFVRRGIHRRCSRICPSSFFFFFHLCCIATSALSTASPFASPPSFSHLHHHNRRHFQPQQSQYNSTISLSKTINPLFSSSLKKKSLFKERDLDRLISLFKHSSAFSNFCRCHLSSTRTQTTASPIVVASTTSSRTWRPSLQSLPWILSTDTTHLKPSRLCSAPPRLFLRLLPKTLFHLHLFLSLFLLLQSRRCASAFRIPIRVASASFPNTISLLCPALSWQRWRRRRRWFLFPARYASGDCEELPSCRQGPQRVYR